MSFIAIADLLPELVAMLALMVISAFFSCSEAAYFSLSRGERASLADGTDAERLAAGLIKDPERLLTAILFWNLLVNMTYFALAAILSARLQRGPASEGWEFHAFALGALLLMIFASELIPKTLGVLAPQRIATLAALPLRVMTGLISGVLPVLQTLSNASARVLVPTAKPEHYLALDDLERAVDFGSGEMHDDQLLLSQERQVLRRIVDLANATVAELMRPRHRCTVLTPPGKLRDLTEGIEGEYLLFTEHEGDQLAAALPVNRLAFVPPERLDRMAKPVVYVPWCATASDALSLLRDKGGSVAAVVNELGETVGTVTLERLLDAVLRDASRADPEDAHAARLRLSAGAWEASGATPLRRLLKRMKQPAGNHGYPTETLERALTDVKSVTVGGLLSEMLDRPPRHGDRVRFAQMVWTVTQDTGGTEGERDDRPLIVRIEPDPQPRVGEGKLP